MSAVARALKTEIAKLEKRLAQIKAILDAKPASRLVEMRCEVAKIIEQCWPDQIAPTELLEPLVAEEKRLLALMKKQRNLIKLIDEQVRIEMEIGDLKNHLFWEDRARA